MAVDKKVFSEFYSKKKNDVYYIDDAILDSKAENIFRNDMFCPECKQAQLILVAKTSKHRAYLKRIPSASHKQECSYNYEYATKKVIQEYVNSLSNAELQDKVDALMRTLCKPKLVHDYFSSTNVHNNNTGVSPMVIPSSKNHLNSLKALRRKKIGTYIERSEEGILYAFYGKVHLQIHCVEKENLVSNQKYKIYFLNILALNSSKEWKKRASFYLGTNPLTIDENSLYYIVFIGCPQFKNNYPNIVLVNKNAFKYEKV